MAATPTTLTAAGLTSLELYAQYAAAAYCNSNIDRVGTKIACSSNACPSVQELSITNYAFLGFVGMTIRCSRETTNTVI